MGTASQAFIWFGLSFVGDDGWRVARAVLWAYLFVLGLYLVSLPFQRRLRGEERIVVAAMAAGLGLLPMGHLLISLVF